jgi:hypothetical protein
VQHVLRPEPEVAGAERVLQPASRSVLSFCSSFAQMLGSDRHPTIVSYGIAALWKNSTPNG